MTFSDESTRLRRLALLYVRMAHRSNDVLSDAELESVTLRLLGRSGSDDRGAVQAIVMDVLEGFSGAGVPANTLQDAARELHGELDEDERKEVFNDLVRIARADGVVLKHERGMLRSVAKIWGLSLDDDADSKHADPWSALHDLAYIYLVLAHSTDNDLSGTEMQVMLNKLREWLPDAPRDDADRMLRLAMSEYAEGQDEERLEAAVASVRSTLPRQQRMAALNDLVKIANADGVFLDNEEDLINHLRSKWEIDPSANYEPHHEKESDG